MKSTYRGFRATENSPVAELMDAYHASSADIGDSNFLAYTPVARVNPYQALVYKKFPQSNFIVSPVLKPGNFLALKDFPFASKTKSLHLHWNSWMTQGIEDWERAKRIGMGMAARLSRLQDFGFNIIWTVHNIYPHDARHVDIELEIQQRISDTANVLHVMSPGTLQAMNGITKIDPSKVVVSPHPSYKGAYPDFLSREEARAALGIAGDEVVFLVFGALKAYKGLSRMLDGFELLQKRDSNTRFRLLVAGKSDSSPEVRDFLDRANVHSDVLVEDSSIPNDKVQYFMRAANVGLVHYTRSLNSGAALLFGAFDVPLVASSTPTFLSELSIESTEFVKGESAADLADSMERSMRFIGNSKVLDNIRKMQDRLNADVVSQEFADNLASRLR